jgi:hypothetical protein
MTGRHHLHQPRQMRLTIPSSGMTTEETMEMPPWKTGFQRRGCASTLISHKYSSGLTSNMHVFTSITIHAIDYMAHPILNTYSALNTCPVYPIHYLSNQSCYLKTTHTPTHTHTHTRFSNNNHFFANDLAETAKHSVTE